MNETEEHIIVLARAVVTRNDSILFCVGVSANKKSFFFLAAM